MVDFRGGGGFLVIMLEIRNHAADFFVKIIFLIESNKKRL